MATRGRTLGRGRVLGAAKAPAGSTAATATATAAYSAPIPAIVANGVGSEGSRGSALAGVVSPSESTISLHSDQSTSKSSLEENDITAAIAASAFAASHGAAQATNRLVCPICSEEMLNRHLDDDHKDLEHVEQDEVKTWFKTQVVKARRFQPLAVLNQKLKGLDVFEPNEEIRRMGSPAPAARLPAPDAPPVPVSTPEPVVDPDELVTKDHWQRYTKDGLCSDPMCDHRLGGSNGNINCRKCGKLFCEEHTMYQMKLSRSAQWEPVRGYWCRVCETCYKSREGYIDHTAFAAIRRKAVDKSYLEVSRLEKRLTKLTQLLADPALQQDDGGVVSYLWSISGNPSQQRQLEQSLVDWEDDAKVSKCPFCQQEFSTYSFRRHHCRLCGRVVCADPNTSCSSQIGLNVARPGANPEKPDLVPVDVRLCQDCKRTLFSKADLTAELKTEPADQRAFVNLKQFERGIQLLMPRFQKLLTALQDPDTPPTPAELTDATRARKRLTDAFTQYSVAARRIKELPTASPTQLKLQQQVFVQASNFLHIHMLPLKALPKLLKHASPNGAGHAAHKVNGHLAPTPPRPRHSPSASFDSTDLPSQSSVISELESEEKELAERLIVLEEQRFMVEEMLRDAQRRRKFEEVESLGRNVAELGRECDAVRGMLEQVGRGFGQVYGGSGGGSTRQGKGLF